MKTVIAYYTYTGHTKKIATELAVKESADIVEIKDIKRPSKLKAYTVGCFAAMKGKMWKIQPLGVDFSEYDRIILLSPVWAGNPPPAVNAVLNILPQGKAIEVKMVSSSGNSNCSGRMEAIAVMKRSRLEGFEDIKA